MTAVAQDSPSFQQRRKGLWGVVQARDEHDRVESFSRKGQHFHIRNKTLEERVFPSFLNCHLADVQPHDPGGRGAGQP